jgi:DNA polymerase V
MDISSLFVPLWASSEPLTYVQTPVTAGFPSPADDYLQGRLNLQELLVQHPAATFFMRVAGDSMTPCGIFSGDVLVVDRSLTPKDGSVIIGELAGAFTVKRLRQAQGTIMLMSDNPAYPPITVTADIEFAVWGVVTHVIHGLQS